VTITLARGAVLAIGDRPPRAQERLSSMVHRPPANVLVAQLVEQRDSISRRVIRIEAAARQQLAQHIGPLEHIGVAPARLRMDCETGIE
jgi:hypothetical protein